MKYSSYEQFVRNRVLLYLSKNEDYGDSFNDSLNLYGEVAFYVRAFDKLKRIDSLLQAKSGRKVADEKIEDTILDLYGYCLMFKMWKDEDLSLKYFTSLCYGTDATKFIDFLTEHKLLLADNVKFFESIMALIPLNE
jgi:hypothetical protein